MDKAGKAKIMEAFSLALLDARDGAGSELPWDTRPGRVVRWEQTIGALPCLVAVRWVVGPPKRRADGFHADAKREVSAGPAPSVAALTLAPQDARRFVASETLFDWAEGNPLSDPWAVFQSARAGIPKQLRAFERCRILNEAHELRGAAREAPARPKPSL